MKKFVQATIEAKKKVSVIISAEVSRLSEKENALRTIKMNNTLQFWNIPYEQVNGCYKGFTEQAFLCVLEPDDGDIFKSLCGLASLFDQESILVKTERGVYVVHLGMKRLPERIGDDLIPVDEDTAHENGPFVQTQRGYWIVR